MAEDRAISVRLNGHNYSYWSSVFKNFVVGKEMWGHIAGSVVKPPPVDSKDPEYAKKLETYVKDFAKWEVENAKILTWFHNSVEPSIGMSFSKYDTAKEVWDYLKRRYLESNFAKQYELEGSIRRATQGDKTIQEFYNEMTQYWDQVELMEPAILQSLDVYVEYREKLHLVQFLMALRDEFEPFRGAMLHRSLQPTVDGALHELIAEETRFKVGVGGPSPNVSSGAEGGYSIIGGKTLQRKMVDSVSEHPMSLAALGFVYDEEFAPLSGGIAFASKTERRTEIELTTQGDKMLKERPRDIGVSHINSSCASNLKSNEDESLLPTSFGKKQHHFPMKQPKPRKISSGYSVGAVKTDSAKGFPLLESFDICLSKVAKSSLLDSSLNENITEELIEMEHSAEITGQVLRQGMVLLKGYITLSEQVQIVKICRTLGMGPGGFYQPGYRDGAKLRMQMMCLGLEWDPQMRKYETHREFDGSEPHVIPHVFNSLVKRGIRDSHALVGKHYGICNVEGILPDMSPNICIVNFYGNNGRLGLHQDRDESKESLDKGLPVVSFSIGDSAEFLYGDQRDVNKAEKLILESGDVLIFGGKSRHIFHGVSSIISNSAPLALVEEAKIRPGRLNLTFRQS